MSAATKAAATAQIPDFIISRVFNARRDLLWQCFTEPARMRHWWGPRGFKVLSSKMDFRVGGTYHYGMKAPDGSTMWGRFVYREIVPQERIVFMNSFSDEAGGVTRHPLHQTWPLLMLTTFTFEDEPGGKTKFTVHWRPLDATAEEEKTFDSNRNSMRMGWTGTMDQLEAYLANTRA